MKQAQVLVSAVSAVALAGSATAQTHGDPVRAMSSPMLQSSAPRPAPTPALTRPVRPEADIARDAARKPAAMIAFAGIKAGDKVGDLIPGGGYFTRIFAGAVGPRGAVYALVPAAYAKANPKALTGLETLAASPGYGNVKAVAWDPAAPTLPPLDVIWTSQNYHDLHNSPTPGAVEGMNRAVFAALKPGGVYVVLDHVAASGSGLAATKTLHRIDPAAVKAEVVAAGFTYEGESTALRNTADPHTAGVFDPSVKGRTDQFVYKFRKPLR